MKATKNAKVPFGAAKYSPVKNVRYVSWEDAFDVEFDDGLCILEPHSTIRAANQISPDASSTDLRSKIGPVAASSSTTTTARPPRYPGRLFGS